MNVNRVVLIVLVVALALGAAVPAQAERPYIGVRLDPAPLPDLVVKHLRLEPDQGIRIRNVNVSSPADKIGLARDDIIIRFQGEDVTDLDQFIDAVKEAGIGAEVTLHVIHVGQRKTLEFELEALEGDLKWKYPLEPEAVTSWQPGRFFKVGPDEQNWTEFYFDKLPDVDTEVKKFFNQRHVYRHSADGEDYTITIEGDPRDENSRVTVQADGTEHSTTVGDLDELPEAYREAAEDALEGAKKSSRGRMRMRRFALPKPPEPDVYRRYFHKFNAPQPNLDPWLQRKNEILERLQEQMERLQDRLDALEDRHKEALDKLRDRKRQGPREDGEAAGEPQGSDHQDKPTV